MPHLGTQTNNRMQNRTRSLVTKADRNCCSREGAGCEGDERQGEDQHRVVRSELKVNSNESSCGSMQHAVFMGWLAEVRQLLNTTNASLKYTML